MERTNGPAINRGAVRSRWSTTPVSGAGVASGLLGIFTERDALKLMAAGVEMSVPITDVMSSSPVTLSATSTIAEAIKKMSLGGYRHLPIVDAGGQPSGVAGVQGIVHYLVDHFPNTIYNLPPDPSATQREREGA